MASRLNVSELDFDTIKENLKSFLQQQSEFTDYDFEGSGLNVLLDILAYNTHYNAYYLNMVANEAFIDSAVLRDSVVSHAKLLGYTPYSRSAASATITLTVESGSNTAAELTIPRGYNFQSNLIDDVSYNFVVLEETTVTKSNTQFVFENLTIHEGNFVTYSFTHSQSTNPKAFFTLPDENIDTTTLSVSVRPSASNTDIATYTDVTEVLDVSATSEVYFLQESRLGYQIYFGDDVIGKKLPDGAIVTVTYLVTSGTAANKANDFVPTQTLDGFDDFTVDIVTVAAGGAEKESVDNIKFSAPLQYTTQNRLVTVKDYEAYILQNYPSVDSISVWGGEDNIPPVYGKVFVSLKPRTNYYLSLTEKQRVIDEIIKPKSMLSVKTEILDPEYLYLIVNNKVKYDSRKTTSSETTLKTAIRNAVIGYKTTNLDKFSSIFILSKFQDTIDSVDNSILGSETVIRLQKRFEPTLSVSKTYEIAFNAPLHRGTISNKLLSSEFTVYDATNVLRTVIVEELPGSFTGISSIEVSDAGIDYVSPTVTITGDGTGATAVATVRNGTIQSITITNRGTNYTKAVVTITDASGYGATATATIDSRTGTLRTVYFNSAAERIVVDSEAGTVNYDTGLITLNDLKVESVIPSDGLIRIDIESEEGIIETVRNTIITIDEDDPVSIVTTLSRSA